MLIWREVKYFSLHFQDACDKMRLVPVDIWRVWFATREEVKIKLFIIILSSVRSQQDRITEIWEVFLKRPSLDIHHHFLLKRSRLSYPSRLSSVDRLLSIMFEGLFTEARDCTDTLSWPHFPNVHKRVLHLENIHSCQYYLGMQV